MGNANETIEVTTATPLLQAESSSSSQVIQGAQVQQIPLETVADRESRALAGLSMGSAITTNVAVKRTDIFASIGILSAGIFTTSRTSPGGTKVFDNINPDFLKDPAATNKKIKLLFFTCGSEDNRLAGRKQT